MRVVIREARDVSDYLAIEKIIAEVWGIREDVVPYHILRAIHHCGGCVYVAEIDGKIVGFVYGFPAFDGKKVWLHSHQLAVLPEFRNRGIAFQLKLAQREHALKLGLDLITWTYDPLMAVNAWFNVGKLGGIVRKYLVNFYGQMRDSLNVGIPSDRFWLEWWIRSERVSRRLSGERPRFEDYADAARVLETEERGTIRVVAGRHIVSEDVVLVEVPWDYQQVKRTSMEEAVKWRLVTREIFLHYLGRGYIVSDFVRDLRERRCFYVLKRASLDEILAR